MYKWVNNYIGIPFLSGGRDCNGVDCYGLVRLVMKEQYSYDLPVFIGTYTNALNLQQTKNLFIEQVPVLTGENLEKPQEGAICLIKHRGLLSHVGIYAGDNYIIHSRDNVGVILEKIGSPNLRGAISGWYKINEGYRIS